jgi:aminoglycoside/choline kinase family phosphotransferase
VRCANVRSRTCAPCLTDTEASAATQRADARLAWARAASGDATLMLSQASSDAGFRSYWRGVGAGNSVIVMDSPPALEDVRPWLAKHALLDGGGVRVPRIDAVDREQGFLLLEDLGPQTLLDLLTDATADTLFEAAIEQLVRLQRIDALDGVRRYDDALYLRDHGLFDDWFLGRHLRIEFDCETLDQLELVHRRLIDAAQAQAHVLVHRDFIARNLMPALDGPAVLDFQDAVIGPIAYDPISLFRDAFQSWPAARVDAWLQRYHAVARDAGLPVPAWERFRRDCDWIGLQRHLKILGIFARLHHRDGKTKYLADAPRFVRYIADVLPLHPELAPLQAVFERHVFPTYPTP